MNMNEKLKEIITLVKKYFKQIQTFLNKLWIKLKNLF